MLRPAVLLRPAALAVSLVACGGGEPKSAVKDAPLASESAEASASASAGPDGAGETPATPTAVPSAEPSAQPTEPDESLPRPRGGLP
jgi:hypothetical protein